MKPFSSNNGNIVGEHWEKPFIDTYLALQGAALMPKLSISLVND